MGRISIASQHEGMQQPTKIWDLDIVVPSAKLQDESYSPCLPYLSPSFHQSMFSRLNCHRFSGPGSALPRSARAHSTSPGALVQTVEILSLDPKMNRRGFSAWVFNTGKADSGLVCDLPNHIHIPNQKSFSSCPHFTNRIWYTYLNAQFYTDVPVQK